MLFVATGDTGADCTEINVCYNDK